MIGAHKALIVLSVLAIIILGVFARNTLPIRPVQEEIPAARNSANTVSSNPTVTYLDPVRGNLNARVTIIEFGDYQCTYCAEAEPVLRQFLSEHPDVRLVWKDFPLPVHPLAARAARAAHCAGDQGKYWEYHDALMEQQGELNETLMNQTAAALALNQATFAVCLLGDSHNELIRASFEEGAQNGVDGVPYFFIGTTRLSGQVTLDEFEQALTNTK